MMSRPSIEAKDDTPFEAIAKYRVIQDVSANGSEFKSNGILIPFKLLRSGSDPTSTLKVRCVFT